MFFSANFILFIYKLYVIFLWVLYSLFLGAEGSQLCGKMLESLVGI